MSDSGNGLVGRVSANTARLMSATVIHHGVTKSDLTETGIAGAMKLAFAIEDAVQEEIRKRTTQKEAV